MTISAKVVATLPVAVRVEGNKLKAEKLKDMKRYCFVIIISFFYCAIAFAQQSEWKELIDKKQFDLVISQAANLLPADTADFSKMYLIGQAYEGLLKYRDAYNYYKQCYVLDSTRTDMLNTLARISGNLGRVREAEKYYKQVIEYDSTDFYANYQLARLYVQTGNNREGLKYYDYLLERDPENSVILRAKGDCYTRMDSLFPALECYDKAYSHNVENAPLAALLINTLLTLHHPLFNNYVEVASSVCDTALFYNPADITLRQKKAMIHFMNRDYLAADSVYTSLLADRDSSFITLKYCGCSRYYAQNWFDAIEPFEKAFAKDSTAGDVCIMLGVSLGRTYDVMKAFEYFDRAEKLMEPDEYWSNMLIQSRAEMYVKKGDCKKGSELYYLLWKKDRKQLSWLQNVHNCYGWKKISDMSDDEKQRFLFICFLYASEVSEVKENTEQEMYLFYLRSTLKKFHEEMFFAGVKSFPMVSPDNKKNTMSEEKLKELIDKLPEK